MVYTHQWRQFNFVCVDCRRAKRGRGNRVYTCPNCSRTMNNIGFCLEVPPRHCLNRWKKLAEKIQSRKDLIRTIPEEVAAARLQMRQYDRFQSITVGPSEQKLGSFESDIQKHHFHDFKARAKVVRMSGPDLKKRGHLILRTGELDVRGSTALFHVDDYQPGWPYWIEFVKLRRKGSIAKIVTDEGGCIEFEVSQDEGNPT